MTSQSTPLKIVYSYNRKDIDSLRITVDGEKYPIYDKVHKLSTEFDSVTINYRGSIHTATIILRGYKKDLWCIPFIDTMVPPFRMSYGLNFECIKLIS